MSTMLTIAIPTYRRAYVIERTVRNVVKEIKSHDLCKKVEILICDNASNDGTEEIIDSLKKEYFYVSINKKIHSENIGADLNFNACVQFSKSKFVWILGSDDIISDAGVLSVINFLNRESELVGLSVNYGIYESVQQKLPFKKIFTPSLNKDQIFDFEKLLLGDKELEFSKLYLGYFPFISSLIVKKSEYLKAINLVSPLGSQGYDFISLLLEVFAKGKKWGYLNLECIKCMREPNQDDFVGFYGEGSWYAFEINSYLWKMIESDSRYEPVSKKLKVEFFNSYIMGDLIRLATSDAAWNNKKKVLSYIASDFRATIYQNIISNLLLRIPSSGLLALRKLKRRILN